MDTLTRLGRYRLLRKLGHGGMAEVYLAQCFGASGFEKTVAIKTLLPTYRGIGDYERLLIEEAKLGARLIHRNLVAVHELAVDQGIYYVCMEYVAGGDLATLVKRRPLPEPLALLIAEEIAYALAYMHRLTDERGRPLGLVHRDVSAGNVLISRAGEVKLCDFGIAKATVLAEVTLTNMRKGTYAYMSPEQVAGEPLGPTSDQFGLGVLLAELLCGERPFDGPTVADTLDNIKAAKPAKLPGLSRDVRRLVHTCLARDPSARFASADELGRAIALVRRRRDLVTPSNLGAWAMAALPDL